MWSYKEDDKKYNLHSDFIPVIKNESRTNIENLKCNESFKFKETKFFTQENSSLHNLVKEYNQLSESKNANTQGTSCKKKRKNLPSILSLHDKSSHCNTICNNHDVTYDNINISKHANAKIEFFHRGVRKVAQETCSDDGDDVLPNLDFCSESDLSTSPFSLNLCQSEDTVNLSLKVEDRHENLTDAKWLMHDKDGQFVKKGESFDSEALGSTLLISDLHVAQDNNMSKKIGGRTELEKSSTFEASNSSETVDTAVSAQIPRLNFASPLPSISWFNKLPIQYNHRNSVDTLHSYDDYFDEMADKTSEGIQREIVTRLTNKDTNVEDAQCCNEFIFPYEDIDDKDNLEDSTKRNHTITKENCGKSYHRDENLYENGRQHKTSLSGSYYTRGKNGEIDRTNADWEDMKVKTKHRSGSSKLTRSRSFCPTTSFHEVSRSYMDTEKSSSSIWINSAKMNFFPYTLQRKSHLNKQYSQGLNSDSKGITAARFPLTKSLKEFKIPPTTANPNMQRVSQEKHIEEKRDKLSNDYHAVEDYLNTLEVPTIVHDSFSSENTSMIDRRAWLEVEDKKHRYGKKLRLYHQEWHRLGQPNGTFWHWLDGPYQLDHSHSNTKSNELKSQSLPVESYLQHVASGLIEVENCSRLELELDTVHYITEEAERKKYEISIDAKSKKLFYSNVDDGQHSIDDPRSWLGQRKQMKHKLLNTENENGNAFIFVLRDNHIYAAMKKVDTSPRFHHSSFFAGECVEAAGMIVCKDGILRRVYAHSGHYRPSDGQILKILIFLKKHTIDLSKVEFDMQLVLKVARCRNDSMKPIKRKVDTLYLWRADMALHFVALRRYFVSSGLQEQIQRFSF